jgi:riboflavin kinase/FMN adenylyltransferase
MLLEEKLAGLTTESETAVTIGVFDGVHIGHKYLLSKLIKQSKENDLISCVVTFKQHPLKLFNPQTSPPFLTNLTQKTKLLVNTGTQNVISLTFTTELAHTGARRFVYLLQKYLKMRRLILGPDFTLGKNQEGNADFLRNLSQDTGFNLTVVPYLKIDGEIVSSTAIREALSIGDIKKVNNMLGRYYSLEGNVIPGNGRGAEIGFPTANLDIETGCAMPSTGIYTTWAYIDKQRYPSITNIGIRPTFGNSKKTVEVYIFDFNDNLYRRQLKIDIIQKLRGERKFRTIDTLRKQIANDVEQARNLLSELQND